MEVDDLDDLAAVADNLIRNPVGQSTVTSYNYQNALYVLYLYENDRTLLTDTAVLALDQVVADSTTLTVAAKAKKLREKAKELVSGSSCPVKLAELSATKFLQYLLSLKLADGSPLSAHSYGSKRAALFHLYRSFRISQSDIFQSELKTALLGLKRQINRERQENGARLESGMEPMSMGLYKVGK